MSAFLVNGVERACPVPEDQTFSELLDHVRKTLNGESSLISIIRVNGHDVSEQEESALSGTPIASIGSVEVVTVHPKELADETLQTLMPFTQHLELLSRQAAERLGKTAPTAEPSSPFSRLVDGLATFSEAVDSVKEIFGIGKIGPEVEGARILEERLLEKLREILECQQTQNVGRLRELLAFELPAVLGGWREAGIPALIRSRDS